VLVTVPLPVPPIVTDKEACVILNVAVTFWLAFSAIVQLGLVPLLAQAAPHPAKVEPVAAAAVSVTCVPGLKLAWQVGPQLIPEGTLDTVPVPDPCETTVSTGALWTTLKTAVTFSLALGVTVQMGLLLHPPPVQPVKDEFVAAVAVRVTGVPGAKLALQVCPQLIPEGLLVTLPEPVPTNAMVSTGESLKVPVTEVFWVSVSLHSSVPLQAPDHPAKKEFAAGAATSVT